MNSKLATFLATETMPIDMKDFHPTLTEADLTPAKVAFQLRAGTFRKVENGGLELVESMVLNASPETQAIILARLDLLNHWITDENLQGKSLEELQMMVD